MGTTVFRLILLPSEMAGPRKKKYINDKFISIAKAYDTDWVLEKTCANSLRVGFVDEIFPDAKYIHIVRDGRDLACSAGERWTAKSDLLYIFKKLRFVPARDLPF